MTRQIQAFLCSLFIVFLFTITSIRAQQVWTYDFEDFVGERTTGDVTTFLSQVQNGGGTIRIRVSGSNDGRDITVNNIDNHIGTFSRMILDAAATGGRNIFELNSIDATDLAYLRVTVSISAEGENNLEIFLGNDNSAGNTLGLSDLVAGIRFSIEDDEGLFINLQRKSGTGTGITSAHDFNNNPVALDTKTVIEIYVNNSVSALEYYRNGESYPLGSDQQAYWINDTFIAAGPGTTDGNHEGSPLVIGESISTIRFMGGATNGDMASMEIDDIVYSNTLPDIRTIEGDDGWYMLASPYDLPVEQLARQNMIQGVDGGPYSGAGANIYTSLNSATNEWIAPSGISETIERGNGFIWGLYDNALVPESKPLPLALTMAGTAAGGDVTVTLSDAGNGWNLLGNPFSGDLDVSTIADSGNEWANGDIEAVVQIYDPVTDGYILSTGNENKIAAGQGFFLRSENATSITIPESALTSGAEFYKMPRQNRLISFEINATENETDARFTDRSFNLYFSEMGQHGWDMWDATKLTPLSGRYIGLAFYGERNGERVLKAQDSRPFDLQESISISADFFSAGIDGTAEISIRNLKNIPQNWSVEIEDTKTGLRQEINGEQPFRFNFTITGAAKEIERAENSIPVIEPARITSETPRFIVHVTPGNIEETAGLLPGHIALHQNYPNPFNPSTQITYELPQRAEMTLAVYDILGRQVTTLVNGVVKEGTHQVNFDASGLSSGTYIYKLSAGSTVLSRKLTVVK